MKKLEFLKGGLLALLTDAVLFICMHLCISQEKSNTTVDVAFFTYFAFACVSAIVFIIFLMCSKARVPLCSTYAIVLAVLSAPTVIYMSNAKMGDLGIALVSIFMLIGQGIFCSAMLIISIVAVVITVVKNKKALIEKQGE